MAVADAVRAFAFWRVHEPMAWCSHCYRGMACGLRPLRMPSRLTASCWIWPHELVSSGRRPVSRRCGRLILESRRNPQFYT